MKTEMIAPHLPYQSIQNRVDNFVERYHPLITIPIPIEEIVDLQLGINIIPIPGLQDLLGVAGFISNDLKNISVDEYVQNHREGRYRFTLAHEVGHIFLHENLFLMANFSKSAEWKAFSQTISEAEYSKFEFQANEFAGRLLVPSDHLKKHVSQNIQYMESQGLSLQDNWDNAWEYIAVGIGKEFVVSAQVVETRIAREKIKEEYSV